ncbi:MAG: type II toxin-antitoxin system VapB family antitoxin [Mycobacteriaceae bacterium]|uniref:type II toxin-antitoxin system VapB family antitoxin n=1 Tax=Corynebacterium sp. TaxID=1720 RepID=UPI003F9C1C99
MPGTISTGDVVEVFQVSPSHFAGETVTGWTGLLTLGHGPGQVYMMCMRRRNIDTDDALVMEVMRRYDVSTKKDAVDLALRRLAGVPLSKEFVQGLRGIGWSGDLDEMRSSESPWGEQWSSWTPSLPPGRSAVLSEV